MLEEKPLPDDLVVHGAPYLGPSIVTSMIAILVIKSDIKSLCVYMLCVSVAMISKEKFKKLS
jgi:hypothetical protein